MVSELRYLQKVESKSEKKFENFCAALLAILIFVNFGLPSFDRIFYVLFNKHKVEHDHVANRTSVIYQL